MSPRVTISYRFTRPDTTGVHCQSALQNILGKDNVLFIDPDQFATYWEEPKVDLHFAVDDDGEWTYPEDWKRERAVWLIDTHTNLERRYKRCHSFDQVYCAQIRGVDEMKGRDYVGEDVAWLPLACNPDMHYRVNGIKKEVDWAFVGHAPRDRWLPTDRADLLDILKAEWPNHFCGNAYMDDMMVVFSSAHVCFNRSIIDDINMRVFEVMASGTALLTNHLMGQEVLFEPNAHYVGYYDADDMRHKIKWLLENPMIAKRIGDKGRQYALAHHTYEHRMRQVLHECLGWESDRPYINYEERYRELYRSTE